VSDEQIDALAETARNRGLKLVRSRVRTPGKRRFGKVGLTDAGGKAVFGMDDKGPNAKPEDVEHYLRNLGARDWGASLDVAVMPRRRRSAKSTSTAANDAEPAPRRAEPKPPKPPKPPPEPKLDIREAKPADAAPLAELMRLLDHEIDEKTARRNISKLKKLGEAPLVATLDKRVVGLCGLHLMQVIHRDAPVGRITILVVAEDARGNGMGRKLLEEAEAHLRKAGCKIIEVTSNDRLGAAHAFYRHMGYERTSIRFAKTK
jgi:GNAT superfamily N-acetyltransferase